MGAGAVQFHLTEVRLKNVSPYLIFAGEAREAMTFYQRALDGTLDLQTYRDGSVPATPGSEDLTLHAKLVVGDVSIMASDTQAGMSVTKGDNHFISLDCDSDAEVDRLFEKLMEGGSATMIPQDTFWNARFAMGHDRFGIGWMFNHDKSKG